MLALAAVACLRAVLDLLRNARALHADVSDCRLVVCGIARDVSLTELSVAFERFGFLREVTKRRGFAFVEFTSASAASAALAALNGAELRDKRLLIKFAHRSDQVAITKLALDIRVKPGPHQAAQALRKGDASVPSDDASARGDDGVAIGKRRETGTRATQTTGRHILALLKLYRNPNPTHAPFLEILNKSRANHGKEITESFAMLAALERLEARTAMGLFRRSARVIVPGDGKWPMTAAAICASSPDCWVVYSVDPRLDYDTARLQAGGRRLVLAPVVLDMFELPAMPSDSPVDLHVVVAVHSHAPLQRFWDSLPRPKVAVCLPCCGDCSFLNSSAPVLSYDDPEIFSPARKVLVYHEE